MSYAIPQVEDVQSSSLTSQIVRNNNLPSIDNYEKSSNLARDESNTYLSDTMKNLSHRSSQATLEHANEISSVMYDQQNKIKASQMLQLFEKTKANLLQNYLSTAFGSVGKIGQLTQSINSI